MCKSKKSTNATQPTLINPRKPSHSTSSQLGGPRSSAGVPPPSSAGVIMSSTAGVLPPSPARVPPLSSAGVPTSSTDRFPTSSPAGDPPLSNTFSSSRTVSSDKVTPNTSDPISTPRAGVKPSSPENPHIYEFPEISFATGNFKNRFSSSSSSSSYWLCTLRDKEAILFQRKFRPPLESPQLQSRVSTICRSHHSSLIKLLGVSVSGSFIYLAYEFIPGPNLADCLRNPSFATILSTWLSRMQIATDLAQGLDYIHHCSGLRSNFVHNHIKSSSVVVVIVNDDVVSGSGESLKRAKICHFGTSELCGEIDGELTDSENSRENESKIGAGGESSRRYVKKTRSRDAKVDERRGYTAPEFQSTGTPTQKCDVYAFGVLILELLSGEEPLKGTEGGGGKQRVSVIETARAAVEGGEVRTWVDPRLNDSYPVEVAEKMIRAGLDCVKEDPDKRPDMGRVAGLVSELFLESKNWAKKIGIIVY
ncbi:Tyrosine-protein kinase [Parasponia andersonii]|uniref:Tyrosine-protein kinase n=1 Tax=Parasponia andersonii TaxID=3476 RepID=A0A2P5AGW0_PARAD|nr:Tyrosine-protein kinase [Parasponia andersonii]